jgi:arylformamidase
MAMTNININSTDLEKLNHEYSPSSCIDDITVYIQQYVELSRAAKNKAIEQNTLHADLHYGEQKSQCLDLYLPVLTFEQLASEKLASEKLVSEKLASDKITSQRIAPQKKLMVYIHGGYWQELSKEESSFAATNFQKQGFHFAVLDYTLAPDASISDIVEENRQAIAWLYNNAARFGYDPEEIYVCGSSAGAHLAMMVLQTDWSGYVSGYASGKVADCDDDCDLGYQGNLIKGICAVSGIYDLQPLLATYVNDALTMDINEAKENSPLLKSLPEPVPVIIAFGDIETDEFKRQSQIMADKLRDKGFTVQFKKIDKRNHFDVILDLSEKSSWLSQQTIALMTTTE